MKGEGRGVGAGAVYFDLSMMKHQPTPFEILDQPFSLAKPCNLRLSHGYI